jgi:hypothetical protein
MWPLWCLHCLDNCGSWEVVHVHCGVDLWGCLIEAVIPLHLYFSKGKWIMHVLLVQRFPVARRSSGCSLLAYRWWWRAEPQSPQAWLVTNSRISLPLRLVLPRPSSVAKSVNNIGLCLFGNDGNVLYYMYHYGWLQIVRTSRLQERFNFTDDFSSPSYTSLCAHVLISQIPNSDLI